ncbi:MAG: MurR/RpiR family transcriptional regulator [Clostridium sp.]|nr:MurR/RpiR family transcriptional regulator [Clostridium sp.]
MLFEKMIQKDLFTNTENKIVEYIIKNKDELSSLTINELAKVTFSSNASIIRLCKKLGFNGFRNFRIQLLKEMESEKYITNTIDFTSPFYEEESLGAIINNIASLYKESIDVITSGINSKEIERIAECMNSCKRLFVFAYGDTRITAMNFINKMIKINKYPILATENYEEDTMCSNVEKDDCVLFISYSGTKYLNTEWLETLKKKRCSIITITSNEESRFYKESDYKILIPDREHENKIATFYSQLAFQYILSIIYALIYNSRR